MNENYNVSSSPHIRDRITSSNIMLMVVIALLPATFFGAGISAEKVPGFL